MGSTGDQHVEGVHPLKLFGEEGIIWPMPHETVYRVNRDKVSHENIEGEIMVINFDTGVYYNIRSTALTAWEALEQGATFDELVTNLARTYRGEDQEIRADLRSFLDHLLQENLIIEAPGNGAPRPAQVGSIVAQPQPFSRPTLDKYTDMQEFLLADPVHDTDEAGFPKPRTEGPNTR